jgi:hypothetical protein
MKKLRTSAVMYYIIAIIVFVVVIGLSVRITMSMSSSPVVLQNEHMPHIQLGQSHIQDRQINYLPVLSNADPLSTTIISDSTDP